MSIEDLLLPYRKGQNTESNHSISEAVFVVYLASEIINPERYKKLLDDDNGAFKGLFDEYKDVYTADVSVIKGPDSLKGTVRDLITGFTFRKFASGKPEWVINANNKPIPHIAVHCLSYKRWNPFITFIDRIIKSITILDKGIFVNAIGLNYVDQFNWIGEGKIPFELIFRKSNDFLPSLLYSSNDDWGLTLNLADKKSDDSKVVQNIKIYSQRINNQNLNIGIIHNAIHEYDKPKSTLELQEAPLLENIPLNALHSLNKEFLKKILTEEVLNVINLK